MTITVEAPFYPAGQQPEAGNLLDIPPAIDEGENCLHETPSLPSIAEEIAAEAHDRTFALVRDHQSLERSITALRESGTAEGMVCASLLTSFMNRTTLPEVLAAQKHSPTAYDYATKRQW